MKEILDAHKLNIPKDDIECWDRYPKHRWLYESTRLFDAQGIKWSPFKSNEFTHNTKTLNLISLGEATYTTGDIFTPVFTGNHTIVELGIIKGDIKLLVYIDTNEVSIGDVNLYITAFVSMHLNKFSGIIYIELIGNYIVGVHLYPKRDILPNTELMRLAKRIYKK